VSVCDGQTVVLTGAGGVSYEWDNNVTNNIPFVPQLGTTTYSVVGTDANGCQNTSQVVVTVHTFPQPNFQIANNLGCSPVIPTFVPIGNSAMSTCLWNFGNGQTSSNCEILVPILYDQPGCYNVSLTITSEFGCSQTITQNNAVCVLENPVANFTPSPQLVSSINPVSDMLNYSYNAANFEWFFSDGSTSTQISPTHVFNSSGNNTIMLIAISPDGCVDTAYGSVFVNEELIVYVPNTFTPDNDQFNEVFKPVLHSGFDPYNYHLILFNRWGEVMFESYDADYGWDGTYGGKRVQDGTYIWVLTVKRNNVDDREVFKGHVNIIR
jgi:trimeric autotransporter adhesin